MKNRNLDHKDDWATPESVLKPLRDEFGELFDPCPINHDMSWDGLEIAWKQVNFINPPYSRELKEAFIRKAYAESLRGGICIMLLPVSTSTKIFHEIIYPHAEIRFLKGRVKFEGINTKGEKVSTKCGMHDSMIVIFRGKNS
jgi:hypothetical protein